MEESRENFNKIKKSNQLMLDYFNKSFVSKLEEIQSIKTQIFEIDIRMDELDKTKDIYAFQTNSRKSVFSPSNTECVDTERNSIIQEQILDLQSVKKSLSLKLKELDVQLNELKKYLESLNDASDAIASFNEKYESDNPDRTDMDGFTFIQDNPSEDIPSHGYTILMLDAFDRALVQTMLEKNVKSGLEGITNKLDMMSYLVGTDVTRAKLTLQEIKHGARQVIQTVDDVETKLNGTFDSTSPIKEQLEDYLQIFKKNNPTLDIQASVEMPNPDINYHPVFTINFMKLIAIFLDNISEHAGASTVTFQASLTPNIMDVVITDDGTGIGEDYLTNSPWYSSLHKAQEILYMLHGKLNISGDLMSGTSISFSIPILQ